MPFGKSTKSLLLLLTGLATISFASAQTYTVLYSFTGGTDGASPIGGLVMDSAGNLYGTTLGTHPYPYGKVTGTTAGSVFRLSPKGKIHSAA